MASALIFAAAVGTVSAQELPPVGVVSPTSPAGQATTVSPAPSTASNALASAASAATSSSTSTSPGPSGVPSHPASANSPESKITRSNRPPVSDNGNDVYVENTDLLHVDQNNVVTATGNVRVRYQDYTLYSDRAVIDTKSGDALFDGHVRLTSKTQQTRVTGQSRNSHLRLNLRTGNYAVEGAENATIDPNLLSGSGILLPLRVRTENMTSTGNVIDARQVGFTTCDFPNPHYYFGVKNLTIIPGKRLIARHAVFYRRKKRLFELSQLILPLDNRYARQGYLPTVGDSPSEGYFVKFAYPYALASAATGALLLDFLQYKGVGTGFNQSYQAHGPGGGGTFDGYHLYDQQRGLSVFSDSLDHRQTIGDFGLNVDSQYQSNSYFSSLGTSQNLNNRITLTRDIHGSSTSISSTITNSDYGAGLSTNATASIAQQQNIGGAQTADIKVDYAGFKSPSLGGFAGSQGSGSSSSSSIATNLGLHLTPSNFLLDIQANLFSSLQDSGTSFGGTAFESLERKPELLLTTTGTGSDPLNSLAHAIKGSQIQFGLGSYVEPSSNSDTSRIYFGYDLGTHPGRVGVVKTTTAGSFQQSFYGDNTAQYLLNGRFGSDYDRGPIKLAANYSTLRAFGFTPFYFDRTGDYNNANFNLIYSPNKRFDVSAATAYDFLRDRSQFGIPAAPWQNLLAIFDLHPNQDFTNHLQATYDPNHGELYDISNDMLVKSVLGLNLHTAVQYVPQSHKFGSVNGSLDLPLITDTREQSGYKIQALAGYSGFTNQFTYQGIALTRSWHDWELTGTYENNPEGIQSGKTFYFTFHLKAFPGYQPFGVGSNGQGLASGIGRVY